MAEYVTKEQVIDWYRPYGQTDEPIPFETLVSDLRDMKAADVAPVRHGRWVAVENEEQTCDEWDCTACGQRRTFLCELDADYMKEHYPYCPNCGAKMDGGGTNEQS